MLAGVAAMPMAKPKIRHRHVRGRAYIIKNNLRKMIFVRWSFDVDRYSELGRKFE